MKKYMLLVMVLITVNAVAQISISHPSERVEKEKTPPPYDSTKNWLGDKHVQSYIGQTLYVKGSSLPEWGYDNFKTSRESDTRWGNPSTKSEFNTRYEDLVGKSFIVKDVQRESRYYLIQYGYWWFLLENVDNPDEKVWFKYSQDFEHSYPFITLGFYEYLKNNYIGKELISGYVYNKEGELRTAISDYDFYTGLPINNSCDKLWKVKDITIEDRYYYLVFIVEDGEGQTGTIHVEQMYKSFWYSFVTKQEYDSLCEKYSKELVDVCRQGKIRVGMPVELLLKAWGEPKKINRNSSGRNQWVYDNDYVYVENDIIVAWN